MLYVTFKIKEQEKFEAFKKVYDYMCLVRKADDQEKVAVLEIDWDTATEEQIDAFMDEDTPKLNLYNNLFPEYAQLFIARYFTYDHAKSVLVNEDKVSFINYLEYSFEVDLDALDKLNEDVGIIKLSTGNYPFGGLERFFMTLKAFDLSPIECFDGFNIFEFDWTSEFEYEAIILSEETKEYLKK